MKDLKIVLLVLLFGALSLIPITLVLLAVINS